MCEVFPLSAKLAGLFLCVFFWLRVCVLIFCSRVDVLQQGEKAGSDV